MTNKNTEDKVIRLYSHSECSIKEIMMKTGVRSEQTVYAILSRNNIPLRSVINDIGARRSVSFDCDVWENIRDKKNISRIVNDALRQYLRK